MIQLRSTFPLLIPIQFPYKSILQFMLEYSPYITMTTPTLQTITFTTNRNKIAEVTQILGDLIKVEVRALDLLEIQGTTEEIAREKCRRAADAVGHATFQFNRESIVDDNNTRSTVPSW